VSGTLRERRGRWWCPRHGLLALAAAAALGGLTAPASGATNPFTITLVARPCHAYTDVMAKLARNDVQESLRDLGKNSVYPSFDTAAGHYADNIVVSAPPGMTDACRRSP